MSSDDAVSGKLMASGISWTLLGRFGSRAITLCGLALLARLLMPEDFGLLGFALAFMIYFDTIGDLGTGAALIYWPSSEKDVAQITFAVNVVMGFVWFALTYAAAPFAATFFHTPGAEPLLEALAWSYPITALGNTHEALSLKQLRFRSRLIPEIAMALVKSGTSVALALTGAGVWSLVWGQLAGLTAWTLSLWAVVPWRPSFRFQWALAPKVLKYSKSIVALNLIAEVVHHVDLVIVGRMFSAVVLGFYQMAYKIPEMTILMVTSVASKVLFPSFSRLQSDPATLRGVYLQTFRYTGLIVLPAVVGLVMLAEPAVLTLFGDKWGPTIPIARTLAFYAGLRALGNHSGDILKACGRPNVLAGFAVLNAVVLVPTLIVAARGGSVSYVALAMALVAAPSGVVTTAYVCRILQVRPGEAVSQLLPGLLTASLLALVLAGLSSLTRHADVQLRLITGLVVGSAATLLVMARLEPRLLRYFPWVPRPRSQSSRAGSGDVLSKGLGLSRSDASRYRPEPDVLVKNRGPRRVFWLIDSLTMGGAEALVLEFSAASRSAGVDLHVGCLRTIEGNRIEAELRARGVRCTNLASRNLRDLVAFRRLLGLLRHERPDLLHAHLRYASIWGAVASRITGIPMLATLHLMPEAARWWSAEGIRERLMCRLLDRWSSGVIAVSDAVREAHVRSGRIRRRKLRVVRNGVSRREIDPATRLAGRGLRRELGIDSRATVITTVSVLRPGKGVEMLIGAIPQVLERVPDAYFLVVGDGSERVGLERRAEEENVLHRVRFLGYRRDVPRILDESDMFVLATHQDAFPTVLLEAMTAGLPVVASSVGGIIEIVEPGFTGLLVPPGDAGALGRAIVELATGPEKRRWMSGNAKRRAEEEFSTEAWCRRLMRAYSAALERSDTSWPEAE